jgi:3-methyladenine DNA glycosylase AlkD
MATSGRQLFEELRARGKEQYRKIYRRHGVGGEQFGVSYGDLKAIAERTKTDHGAALHLWETANHDARVLATMIADPNQADETLLDTWARALDNYPIADAFSWFVGKTAFARQKAAQWSAASEEWVGTVGWNLVSYLAMNDKALGDDFFAPYLATIERDIHGSQNRVRYAMNNALIAIGLCCDGPVTAALAAAERIGKVEVDHGATDCKTPDAVEYIRKARARRGPAKRGSAAKDRRADSMDVEQNLTVEERRDLIEKLRRLPRQLREQVAELSEDELTSRYLEGEWTVAQNVHHLADAHLNAFARMKFALTEERPPIQIYDQDKWAQTPEAASADLEDSLLILEGLHRRWVVLLEALTEEQWQRAGIHPTRGELTVADLLRTYASHGEAHLNQITKTLIARQAAS